MSQEKLTHLQLIKASGEDAHSFLQGQLSNDVNALNSGWHYSAYCTPKGRSLAVFTIWEHDQSLFLLCERNLVNNILKRLRMYVMRSKVVFEELNAHIIGVFDQQDLEQLNIQSNINAPRFSLSTNDSTHTLSFGNRSLVVDTTCSLSAPEGQQWLAEDINDALPRVTQESSELFIPQMLNMDVLNGISFKKGCYTGQEIIARMKYLGTVKQRGFVCELQSPAHAIIGEKVLNSDGKNIGHIANSTQGTRAVLAILRFKKTEQASDSKPISQEPSHIANYDIERNLTLESGIELKVMAHQPYHW